MAITRGVLVDVLLVLVFRETDAKMGIKCARILFERSSV